MAERKNSTAKEAPSKNRQLHEDRNIPTIKVDIPMPKGAKSPKKSQGSPPRERHPCWKRTVG